MKNFSVEIHYDSVAVVSVQAENEEEALRIAENEADGFNIQFTEFAGAKILNE